MKRFYQNFSTVFLITFLFFTGPLLCRAQNDDAKILHELNSLLINTVMVDVYTPPVAGRIYAYPNIAFYAILQKTDHTSPYIGKMLNGFPTIDEKIQLSNAKDISAAAALCFAKVAAKLVGSEDIFLDWATHYRDILRAAKTDTIFQKINTLAETYGNVIIKWALQDQYAETRAMPRFQNTTNAGSWQLTPADYAAAIEPHWQHIRSFTLDSSSQFSPAKKTVFSADKKSAFYKNVLELYKLTNSLDSNKKAIAKYWDDNPNVSVNLGHLNYFVHKISPGGHWLMITKQACEQKQLPVLQSSLSYTLVSIALFDAFIATWDEKFKTNLIRPITVINQYVDKSWEPYIQTPPFPEFTSGHAVISNAAAAVLTRLFGSNFSFTDNTEIPFGNSTRSFRSFFAAAKEVSWSRVYGGIHYPSTARISIQQGKAIGNFIVRKSGVKSFSL